MTDTDTVERRWSYSALAGLGYLTGIVIAAIDQLYKWWMIYVYEIASKGRVEITSFFDLVMVWNKGVSYGLFPQESFGGRMTLVFFAAVMVIVLCIWLLQVLTRTEAVSIGLIIGGAIGNAVDRLTYGAVADFFRLHIDGFKLDMDNFLFSVHIDGLEWFVFNFADVAIVAGVVGLIIHALFMNPRPEE